MEIVGYIRCNVIWYGQRNWFHGCTCAFNHEINGKWFIRLGSARFETVQLIINLHGLGSIMINVNQSQSSRFFCSHLGRVRRCHFGRRGLRRGQRNAALGAGDGVPDRNEAGRIGRRHRSARLDGIYTHTHKERMTSKSSPRCYSRHGHLWLV